jgi:hypothetical protein
MLLLARTAARGWLTYLEVETGGGRFLALRPKLGWGSLAASVPTNAPRPPPLQLPVPRPTRPTGPPPEPRSLSTSLRRPPKPSHDFRKNIFTPPYQQLTVPLPLLNPHPIATRLLL